MVLNLLKRSESAQPLTEIEHDQNFTNIENEVNAKADNNDARLSDARTPTAHALSHATGQPDAIAPADIGAATAAQGTLADSAVQPDDLPTFPTGDIVGTTDPQTLTSKTLGDLKETVHTVVDGASVDLDPADGPIQVWTLGANRTPTATGFAAGQSMMLMIADGTDYSVTWTTIGVVWVGGSAPTLATSGYTVVELWKVGSTVYGAHVGDVA